MNIPDPRRSALERDVHVLQDVLADAALAASRNPDDQPVQEALAQAQRELAGAVRRIELHDLATQAAAREQEKLTTNERRAEVAELMARVASLHKSSTARALELLALIDQLGPLWAELLVELGEARALTSAAVRTAGGAEALRRLVTMPLDGHAALAAAVGVGLASTGLGVTGPSLAPWAVISPPSGAFDSVDLGRELERLHAQRVDVVERAATFGREVAA